VPARPVGRATGTGDQCGARPTGAARTGVGQHIGRQNGSHPSCNDSWVDPSIGRRAEIVYSRTRFASQSSPVFQPWRRFAFDGSHSSDSPRLHGRIKACPVALLSSHSTGNGPERDARGGAVEPRRVYSAPFASVFSWYVAPRISWRRIEPESHQRPESDTTLHRNVPVATAAVRPAAVAFSLTLRSRTGMPWRR
jgi:hypothetical protein